jgi:hypothetical protein
MPKPNGYVIYHGPSLLDGETIVAIATGLHSGSTNRKTGAMVQTYILRADRPPTEAVRDGTDASICGACPHRGDGSGKGRTCYVNVGQGPRAVWDAWQRGKYGRAGGFGLDGDHDPDISLSSLGEGRVVRLGTYGDPAAVPAMVWRLLTGKAEAWTGYTHQWREARFGELRGYMMASCDSGADFQAAVDAGWRTFRVALPNQEARLRGEAICPASAEAGKKLTCEQCRACGGTARGRRGSIVIQAHGGFAVMANVRRKAAQPEKV